MSGNSFTRISAGTNTPPFKLSGGRYVVTAQPGPTAPGQWGGLCSLQVQQGTNFADVGTSTNFQKPRSVSRQLEPEEQPQFESGNKRRWQIERADCISGRWHEA